MGTKKTLKKTKKQVDYSEEAVQKCIKLVKVHGKSMYKASKLYGVPESTIRYRLSAQWSQKLKSGPATVLTTDEEAKLDAWIKEQERKGFPVGKMAVFQRIKRFLDQAERPNPFKENLPGNLFTQS